MEVGKFTYGAQNIKVEWGNTGAKLTIGKFCSIADNVTVFLGGNHAVEWITTYPFGMIHKEVFNKPINLVKVEGNPNILTHDRNIIRNRNVVIGNDVWIGGGVTIMSGVKIGDGAVIGKNSHVIENVKPYSVVGGNPAKFYYYRFNEEIIKKLLELKWWDFDDNTINEISPYLCSSNYDKLFEITNKLKNK